jgi:hypothetical protein
MSLLDIPARLDVLEQRLAALEEQPATPASDTLTPNVFTINLDGTVSETLTGKLQAKGIIFENGLVFKGVGPGEVTQNEIVWSEPSPGTGLASIQGYRRVEGTTVNREILALTTLSSAQEAALQLISDDHNARSEITVTATRIRVLGTQIGLYGAAPVARAAAVASPAEELKALKVAVDLIREALKKIGITE